MRKILIALSILMLVSCDLIKDDEKEMPLNGTVEIDSVRISSLAGGRIIDLKLDEGQKVKKGDVVAQIDPADLELELNKLQTVLKGAKAHLRLAGNGARKEDRTKVSEMLKQSEIAKDKAEREFNRLAGLFEKGAIPEKQYDDAKTMFEQAQAAYNQVSAENEKVSNGTRREQIDIARASVEQAKAGISIIEKKISDCKVLSPVDGTVVHRLVEKGEIAGRGVPIGIVRDMSKAKVTVFLPEIDLGKVKIGQKAMVMTDSYPDKPLSGYISFISESAEFTPKNIQTRSERVKTVYRAEITVNNKLGMLKAGMPVEVSLVKE
jgi:HlyD family secretion protein